MPDIADTLASFVVEADADAPELRSKARILLADAISLAIGAREAPGVSRLVQGLSGGGAGKHLIWMTGESTASAGDAALLNGVCTHARFQDDTDMTSWSHPASFVIPAATVASELADATLASVLDGIAVGYAILNWVSAEGRVAEAVIQRGFRGSPTFGPLASCAAACRILGLTQEQSAHALRASALLGRGTLHSVGAGGEDWRMHNGGAARDGLTSALAAGAGMRGGVEAFEGPNGFLRAYAGWSEIPEPWREPPRVDSLLSVWHKALPTLGDNMAATLAATAAHEKVEGMTIEGVTSRINAAFASYPGVDRKPPYDTFAQALASNQFVVARGLLSGTITLSDYDTARDDRRTTELATRVELVGDETLDYTEAEVVVHTSQGDTSTTTSELPRTLFYRDDQEAIHASEELLGEAGKRLTERILGAENNEKAAHVVGTAVNG